MAEFTLAALREQSEKKFGTFRIPELDVELVNALRLSKDARARLKEATEAKEKAEAEQDVQEHLSEVIRIVAKTPGQAEKLLKEIGDDVALLATVVENWSKGTQAGEASPSES